MTKPLFIFFLMALGLVFLGVGPSIAQNETSQAAPIQTDDTQTYVIQKGDTLSKIARKFYSKLSLGKKLWEANQSLVAHPEKLTPGDVLFIFPESELELNSSSATPPAVEPAAPPTAATATVTAKKLGRQPELLESFPKYFSFVTNLNNSSNMARLRVKKLTPRAASQKKGTTEDTNKKVHDVTDEVFEVRLVGELVATQERGAAIRNDGFSQTTFGRTLLSTGDNVIVRFTENLESFLGSDSNNNSDPYFDTFPVYSNDVKVQDPNRGSFGKNLGNLMFYKGKITIVAKVDGLGSTASSSNRSRKRGGNQNLATSSVSYVARVTYAEDAMVIGDKVVLFLRRNPGEE
ncbi:MAG: LysM peptidoglycan-binding domain-containing protein [Deltaproteobacteria bacterium]|jgi:hypothetical protein|nr:LysM peptidoglycan-binding domain-containing protein [Deltaproteobacteria bacterium]